MPDPAVEAARRAWDRVKLRSLHVQRVAAAREALKPIQAKCDELAAAASSEDAAVEYGMRMILDAIAPLTHSTEELERQ